MASRSLGRGGSVLVQAYGEGGDVVVKTSFGVAEKIAVKHREKFAGWRQGLSTHPGCEREELAVTIAGLGDPVGIEQQQVTGGEGAAVDAVVITQQVGKAEQWRGGFRLKDAECRAVQEERGRVSAVEDVNPPAVVRDLDEKRGGEALHRPFGGKGAVVPGAAGVEPACDVDHVGLAVGGLAEGVDDGRGRSHCRRDPCPVRHR